MSFLLFIISARVHSLSVCVQVVRASRQVAERRSGGQLRAVRASPAAASRHALCTQAQAAGGSKRRLAGWAGGPALDTKQGSWCSPPRVKQIGIWRSAAG